MKSKLVIYSLVARIAALILTAPLLFQAAVSGWGDPCSASISGCSPETVTAAIIYLFALTALTIIIGTPLMKRAGLENHSWPLALVAVGLVTLLQVGSTLFRGADLETTINDIVFTWGPAIFWVLNVGCYTFFVLVEEKFGELAARKP